MSGIVAYGELAFGELPAAYDNSVANPFATLLASPDEDTIYLVELYPYDTLGVDTLRGMAPFGSAAFGEFDIETAGTLQPVYFSNRGYTTTPTDSLPDQHFPAVVDNALQLDVSILSGIDFISSAPSFGSIIIQNGDGSFDDIEDYIWSGRRAVVKAGGKNFAYDDFSIVFDGSVNGIESDDERIVLTIRDNRVKTDQLLVPDTFAGTGSIEGGTDLTSQPKPLCFGKVSNVEPVLVDSANLIYQVHDGQFQAADAVRDAGVLLTSGGDVADITVASVSAGQYKTQLTGGYIKLGSTPAGRITADLQGCAIGSYVSSISEIINRILTTRLGVRSLGSSEIDEGAFNEVDAVLTGPAGIYVTDKISASSVIDGLLNSCGAYWTFTRHGDVTAGILDEPGVADLELTEDDIEEQGVQQLSVIPQAWRISVGYQPVGVVQREDELAGGASAATRSLVGEQYRYVVSEDLTIRAQNEQSVERVFNTQFHDAADANILLARLVTIFSQKRRIYRVPVPKLLFRVYVGDPVRLTYPRYGLSGGKNLTVVGVAEDVETGVTNLELWG